MTTNPTGPELLAKVCGDRFADSTARTAASLRRIADDLERDAQLDRIPGRFASASALTADLTHTLIWGLANANFDSIATAAAEYDRHVTYAPKD